jgi:recombination protein RecA
MATLDKIISELNKSYGEGTVMQMTDAAQIVPVIPTGILAVDAALGIGGIPTGRVTEVYGSEASGKSSLALSIVAQAQKQGKKCVYIDVENTIDRGLAELIGVDWSELFVAQPASGEEALDIMIKSAGAEDVGLVVLDSVAALMTRQEIEGDLTDANVGSTARLMGKALRKLNPVAAASGCACVFINQLRDKVGGWSPTGSTPQQPTGGNALKFFCSVRLMAKRGEWIKQSGEVVGAKHSVTVIKNKLAAPHKTAEFPVNYKSGVDNNAALFDVAVEKEIITRAGNTYTVDGEKLAIGREKATEALFENTALLELVKERLNATGN